MKFDDLAYPVEMIRCNKCGRVAGVLPYSQLYWMYEQIRSMLQKKG